MKSVVPSASSCQQHSYMQHTNSAGYTTASVVEAASVHAEE